MKYLVQQTKGGYVTFQPAVFDTYEDALLACGHYFADNYWHIPNTKPYLSGDNDDFTEFRIENNTEVLDVYQIIKIRSNPKALDERSD